MFTAVVDQASTQLVVRNTFIDFDVKPRLFRSRSFGGFDVIHRCLDNAGDAKLTESESVEVEDYEFCRKLTSFSDDPTDVPDTDDEFSSDCQSGRHMCFQVPMPPYVGEVLSPLLKQVTLQELPRQLDSNAARLRAQADYLSTLAANARAGEQAVVWHQMLREQEMLHEWQQHVPDDMDWSDGASSPVHSFDTESSDAQTYQVKPQRSRTYSSNSVSSGLSQGVVSNRDPRTKKGQSGAQRRKQKKLAAKDIASDGVRQVCMPKLPQ